MQRCGGNEGVDAHLEVVSPAGEVIGDTHLVSGPRQMQGCWPAEIPVSAEDKFACCAFRFYDSYISPL